MKKAAIIGSPHLHGNYKAALKKADCGAVIFPDASYVERHPDEFDGLLLPGGGDVPPSLAGCAAHLNPLDSEQLHALRLFSDQGKPIFGICKGMQLINLHFGGTIKSISNPSFHQKPKRDVFHPADNLQGSFLHALFGPHMLVNSSHHQCVDKLGQSLQAVQHAPDGTVEALSHLSAPIFGSQWHPERMPEDSRKDALLLFCYFVSLL